MSSFGLLLGYHFVPPCQRRNQAGSPDPVCPGITLFAQGPGASYQPGCCRTDIGVCGYQMDVLSGFEMGLGCVSTGPLTSAPQIACGPSNRSTRVSCECADGSPTPHFCLAVDCRSTFAPDDVCRAACKDHGGLVSSGCEDQSPDCQ
jgi:hypothetical protein